MKYSFELKEPLYRRLIRYALWILIAAAVFAGLNAAVRFAGQKITESTLMAGQLTPEGPEESLTAAEKWLATDPSDDKRTQLVRVAVQAQAWQLADLLMDDLRPAKTAATQALEVIVAAQTAPETLAAAIDNLKAIPQNDTERLLLAQAAVVSGNKGLQTLARRGLHQISDKTNRDRAALWLAEMAQAAGEPSQARDLAGKLLEKNLPPDAALTLLKLTETLKMPEAADYRSSLKMQARTRPALAVGLLQHLAQTQSAQELVTWAGSLPAETLREANVALELTLLQLKASQPEAAAATLKKMNETHLAQALNKILMGENPKLDDLPARELVLYARFCRSAELFSQELQALTALNKSEPHLWSLVAAAQAAENAKDTPGGAAAWESLQTKMPKNALVELESLTPRLLDENIEPRKEYEKLTQIYERYGQRREVKTLMAYAHCRLGNLTDALLALPQDPTTPRQKLLCAVILARAGQNDKAAAWLKEVPPNSLSGTENELYEDTQKRLQASRPLQQIIETILPNA